MAKRKMKRLGGTPAAHKYHAGQASPNVVKRARKTANYARAGHCSEALDQYEIMWREYENLLVHNAGHLRGGSSYEPKTHKLGTIAVKASGVFRKFCLKK